jgi:hypothetical protein
MARVIERARERHRESVSPQVASLAVP